MDNKKTGALIAELRKEKNLKQSELAQILFVSDKTISKWETGKGAPEISMLIPIAEALDISVAELLEGERAQKGIPVERSNKKIVQILNKKRLINISVFLISTVCLLISLRLFWSMGIFVDEYNLSPDVVVGGAFGNLLDWLRMLLLFVTSILSLVGIFKKG